MNRKHRGRLRQIKRLAIQVKKLAPKKNELLVMRYESDAYTVQEANDLFQTLADGLKRDIIALPNKMDLTTEECKDLIAELQSLMEGGTS